MPIYEYQCEACSHHLEVFQKINEAALKECPGCGEHKLQKLVSATSFQLKGTGWYATDFRNKGQQPTKKEKEEGSNTATGSNDAASNKTSDGTAV